jgi:predicted nuclease of restriction endonuclease-like (RecB) superfamily
VNKLKKPVPLYEDIRALVLSARQTIARGVDLLQVHTNYEIGRRIVEEEQQGKDRAEYGSDLLNDLSARLSSEFGSGFSRSNLEYMRRFYLAYPERAYQISQTVSGILGKDQAPTPFSLSWWHYVFLIGLKEAERSFYEIEATQQGWTLRELKRQFNAGLYERLALSRDKDSIRELARKGQHVAKPQDLLKEPYVLEFLGLQEKASYSESELESAIVTHIENFLLELGKGFLFEARQKRFTFDEEHFFVDLGTC